MNCMRNATETAIKISDFPTQPHNGKKIDELIVSQYVDDDPYAVTYSKEDNSIHGWLVNIEENGQQRPDVNVYFKLDAPYDIISPVLYKKILVFYYNNYFLKVIDLSGEGQFLQLEYDWGNSVGFLPNDNLIVVSSERHHIYRYSFIHKPSYKTLWKCYQAHDIKRMCGRDEWFIYQTKLFHINCKGFVAQWNLLKMTFEMQYNLVGDVNNHYDRGHYGIMINKNQTLLALYNRYSGSVDIYLMETGIHVSRYVAENYIPVEFVTSKDGSEGLLIFNDDYRQYRFLDPFHPSEEVDISTCVIENPKNILITKSNKTLYIKENNVWVTDGLTLPTLPANLENFDNDFSKFDKELILSIINDTVEFSKYGSKILQMAINEISSVGNSNEMCKYAIQLVFDKIIELIETENYHYMALLPIISLKLPELCDHHYSSLVMKYILFTSILLDPYCLSVKNSTTSLYAEETLTVSFIVPFPQICKYQDKGKDYNPWNEMLCKPKSILFCNIDSNNFYQWWNFAAIIDFKWKTFGMLYYFLIWFFYTIFFICFALATTLDQNLISNFNRKILFILSILLGLIHLSFEIRQFLWKSRIYVRDPWNLFDLGAYSLPIITSIYWLINEKPPLWIIAFSNLLLNFKFMLFFRVFQSFGKYFAIIIGVAKEVFPFLIVLFLIIIGFAHAFFILLRSIDPDLTKYNSINSNGVINSAYTLVQIPDSNTNMFNKFSTSLLAMYLFLTGDPGSLSSWSYVEQPTMTLLFFLFTFSTVIYLMNLFIGLLNMAIVNYNKHEEFLLLKAQIIMEIELFYMSYSQRRHDKWFPDWIYYDMPVDEVRKLINAIDDHRTEFHSLPFISKRLRELVGIIEPTVKDYHELKQANSELKQANNELKQQIKDIQELLNNLVKNLNASNK
ncbi:hypothetical protein GLOIN_2v1881038 [Rhizophagus irregularis DAOM 181602=DAOM 197198]|nr:hypothetical protein GLOIN_2v1881038 [Rhizophagus irregularis DAOM 181602=DAOM 197198]